MAIRPTRRGGYTEEGDDGLAVLEQWTVDGLSGLEDAAAQYAALTASGLPQRGEGHPYVPGVYVRHRRVTNKTHDACDIAITWTPRTGTSGTASETEPVIMRLVSGSVLTTTEVDKDGNPIVLQHTYTSGPKAGATDQVGGAVEIEVPVQVFEGRRLESGSPRDKGRDYVGAVNATPFAGDPARTWKIDAIECDTRDGGLTYDVLYRASYNPDTWDSRAVYIDPDTGQRPPDLVVGEGLKIVRVRPEVDFGPLNLVVP